MNRLRSLAIPLLMIIAVSATQISEAREEVDLNRGWKFHLGEVPDAALSQFDDSDWQRQDLPHDWAFRAPYDKEAAQTDMGGYKPGGIGWYRRALEVPDSWSDKRVRLHFDGIYMDSSVWVNGQKVGGRRYGYMSFDLDITKQLRPGPNVISVRVDNSLDPSARWYHPCGIYAPVSLIVTDPIHIAASGVQIQTPEITRQSAKVEISTTLINEQNAKLSLTTRIIDPNGEEVAKTQTQKLAGSLFEQLLSIESPQLWDLNTPRLYTAISEVRANGELVDSLETRFGIRSIRWETETGFWLNGRNLKLKGVADHLEAGPVGGEAHSEIIRWKIKLLKEMGVNAIRVAHNPQVPEFYAACDELGMLVMDEIFDGWHRKAPHDYGARFFEDNWRLDLTDWVKRNRNHPSIIIYSVGNETRGDVAPKLVDAVRQLDPTRPVTSGHSASEHMDVFGVNGHSEKQHFFKEKRPDKPFVSTEAPHTWQVRGYYRTKTWWRDGYPNKRQDPFPLEDLTEEEIFTYDWAPASQKTSGKQVFNSSYDNAMVRITARKNWELMRDLPWFSGHFRWTGFDYVGEAGYVHGGWPFRAFMGGALDLAGFKKDLFYFYQSQWTEEPMVHLLPHWTHPKMKLGTSIPVWAYSNADEVELFLNGRSLGRNRPGRKAEEMQCEWRVPWEPGILEAIAYKDGAKVAHAKHVTANAPTKIQVKANSNTLAKNAEDFAVITVSQHDSKGDFYPYGENRVTFHLEGPARILSLENGNPVDTEPNFGRSTRRAFFGLARAFVQATGEAGDVSMTIAAINGERRHLTSDLVSIDVKQIDLRGQSKPASYKIRYTTDDSEPNRKSPLYQKPFSVELGAKVRAKVYRSGKELFAMEETFASDVGIHWLAPGESGEVPGVGLQTEDATLENGATASDEISGHYGTGYAILDPGAQVKMYQENDGSFGQFALRIRYQSKEKAEIRLKVNDLGPQRIILPASPQKWSRVLTRTFIAKGGNQITIENNSANTVLIDEVEVSSNH